MKKNKKIAVAILGLIFCLVWLFLVPKPKEKSNPDIVLKTHTNGFKKRKIKSIKQEEKILLEEKCLNFFLDSNANMYFIPYEKKPDYNILKYNKDGFKKIKLTTDKSECKSIFINNEQIHTLLSNPLDSITLLIGTQSPKQVSKISNVKFDYTIQIDDSCIYLITNNNKLDIYHLSKYNYFQNKFVDSLNLNKEYSLDQHNLNLILFGRIYLKNNTIVYKSIYSSEGLIINKYNFSEKKKFKSIDSISLPKIVIREMAEGVRESVITPMLLPCLQLEMNGNDYVILSRIGIKKKTSYIDVYTHKMSYKYSYELPDIDPNIKPYALKFSKNGNEFYILYDDYVSIIKYKIL